MAPFLYGYIYGHGVFTLDIFFYDVLFSDGLNTARFQLDGECIHIIIL
jgi:hypothetical protein